MNAERREALQAISIAPLAKAWLAETEQAYVLQSFQRVVNLVNQESNVLSLVSSVIGNGPFSLVIEKELFPPDISADAQIEVRNETLRIDDLLIQAHNTPLWENKPNWGSLRKGPHLASWAAPKLGALLLQHALADSLARLVLDPSAMIPLPARILEAARQNISKIYLGVKGNDIESITAAAKALAGLGPGLTPAGDDFLVGLMHGLWATRPEARAASLSELIAKTAAPRTHALSAAWMQSAALGDAAEPWHELLDAIAGQDATVLERAAMRILPTGHTSGADALGGFLGILLGRNV